MESNPFGLTLKDVKKAKKLGDCFAKKVGCKTVECLYEKVSHCMQQRLPLL